VQARTGRWTRTRRSSSTPSPSATARVRPARAPRTPRPWRRISSCAGRPPARPLPLLHALPTLKPVCAKCAVQRAGCLQLRHDAAIKNALSLYRSCKACRHQPFSPPRRQASHLDGRSASCLTCRPAVSILERFCRQCGKPRSGERPTRPPPRGPRQRSRRPLRLRRHCRCVGPCLPSARASRSSLLLRSRRQPQTARRLRRQRQ